MTSQTGTKLSSEETLYAKLLVTDNFSLPYIKHLPCLSFPFAAITLWDWLSGPVYHVLIKYIQDIYVTSLDVYKPSTAVLDGLLTNIRIPSTVSSFLNEPKCC